VIADKNNATSSRMAMLLLSTPIVLCGALFQSLDQILGEIADQKLRHVAPPMNRHC
jgi:hypothetical protein